jgi:hypothetical protein
MIPDSKKLLEENRLEKSLLPLKRRDDGCKFQSTFVKLVQAGIVSEERRLQRHQIQSIKDESTRYFIERGA